MNYLNIYAEFTTVEEGEKMLEQARKLRDQMGGALYYGILSEDVREIHNKLEGLRRKERKEKESQG